jgi:hypothetical protein
MTDVDKMSLPELINLWVKYAQQMSDQSEWYKAKYHEALDRIKELETKP